MVVMLAVRIDRLVARHGLANVDAAHEPHVVEQLEGAVDARDADADARKAVIDGLANTGRVITSAALIMVCVFSSFILSGDAIVKQFGVGLAVAIAIDATIVRCLFVPAVMALMGRAAWWLPGPVDRVLPKISVEGEDYFEALEERRASAPPANA